MTEIAMQRTRLEAGVGKTVEWKSKVLRDYQRRMMAARALIASIWPQVMKRPADTHKQT